MTFQFPIVYMLLVIFPYFLYATAPAKDVLVYELIPFDSWPMTFETGADN